jgi:hypothetical protein
MQLKTKAASLLSALLLGLALVAPTVAAPPVAHADGRSPVVNLYTSNGTWTKYTGAVVVDALCVGPGGGGGSGARTASGTASSGGAGGGGGGLTHVLLPASLLTSTVSVTVPTAGTGGLAQSVDSTNGNAGTTASGGSAFGSYVLAGRGFGGAGGVSGGASTAGVAGPSLAAPVERYRRVRRPLVLPAQSTPAAGMALVPYCSPVAVAVAVQASPQRGAPAVTVATTELAGPVGGLR